MKTYILGLQKKKTSTTTTEMHLSQSAIIVNKNNYKW